MYQYKVDSRSKQREDVTCMQNSLFQHETLGLYFNKNCTSNLANKENAHLRKMLYPSNKASLYQRHFSRALTP